MRNEATEEHNGLYIRKHQVVHRESERLGSPNYTELYRGFGYPLDDLADQCRHFLESTERLWEDAGDRFFRNRIGLGLGEIERWDVARVFRGAGWDEAFPKDRDAARARRRRSPTSASTCARSATSSSISRIARTRRRARSACRSRSPTASCS